MKQMVLFSVDRKVARYLKTSFEKIIGHLVTIHMVSMEEVGSKPMDPDLVFVSGEFLRPKAKALFPDAKIITPRRVIVGRNLEQVFLLPKGRNVLVVNSPRHTSEETIESLNKLGFTHLNYIPFWKGRQLDFNNIHAAISPGMMHLCPREIETRIDIGPRSVSIHSFLKILDALGLDLKYLEKYSDQYHNRLLDSSRKLARSFVNTQRILKQEKIIINEFEDGLIYVDKYNRIDLVNKAAAGLFKQEREKLISRNIDRVMEPFEILAKILEQKDKSKKSARIYNINGEKTVVTRIGVPGEKTSIHTFRRLSGIRELEKEVRVKLKEKGHVTKYSFSSIWTRNLKMKDLIEKARDFASTGKNILITGESGMGKELFAHAIHQASPFRKGPFVAVNFAGIVDSLIESELFGYESGAFTGAKKGGKKGFFEQAQGGTIFLDEIGDAPLNVQSSLLRVLQEREVLRVGGSSIIPVEVRIIAATNKDIFAAIRENKFRNDLFYRLNTFPINIPPLREHKEDILYILQKYFKTKYKISKTISPEAQDCLLAHDWPGNIRELLNIAEFVFYSSKTSPHILPDHFPDFLWPGRRTGRRMDPDRLPLSFEEPDPISRTFADNGMEPELVRQVLAIIRERQGRLCGRNSLRKEMARYGYPLSEGRMKKCLTLLKEAGMILVGRTKQGTKITPDGRAYILRMEQGNPAPHGPAVPESIELG
ncbi:sigma-54 interaction domain-containing protein [Desulfospira joergensenii]|uniref:sigma-54 interaction domain-containing protein n=1 Tax=Desulfospira joergensenii TaxID=53329 RepID=UPI0003B5B334|nr:sigma 54-interacting transcriptional regulator [Desulfospira joergensenii]